MLCIQHQGVVVKVKLKEDFVYGKDGGENVCEMLREP